MTTRPAGGTATGAARATFATGSIMRHVVVMTATGSVGLMAVFFVDVINLFYISLLGEEELAAAIGYAGTVLFFIMSVSIGLSIAVTAKVSRSLGAGDRVAARRQATTGIVSAAATVLLATLAVMPFQEAILSALGATGRTHAIADGFLTIVMPANPILTVGMASAGVLRAAGDARRGMYVTLGGAIATALIDPILIFGLDLGVTGAAISSVISRCLMAGIGLYGAYRIHGLIERPRPAAIVADARPLFAIALPAVMTNLATPVGNAFVTASMATFGTEAVAAWAVIGRLFPLAFGGIFALSGSIGGIFGQNVGAGRYDRVRRTLSDSMIFTMAYVAVVWIVLMIASGSISDAFQAEGRARELITFFCFAVAPTFLFTGALFVANAAFNNLGFATYSTGFNWARSTFGVIPFCWAGAILMGAEGVLLGWGVGGVLFGIAAVLVAFRAVGRLSAGADRATAPGLGATPVGPFTSGKGGTVG
ncbi:MAG TPA: MATE family efflux transporter [Methylomirabilota bacterium]|nr:MATE family efflux transporter [Methylomirabilota bacterium]